MAAMIRTGSCRCGQVRFELAQDPVMTMACHCRGCQRMTSSAFSLTAMTPDEGFAVTAGEPVIGGLHGATRHFFCPRCMSWLFTRPEGVDAFVAVRTPMLDDPSGLEPFVETMTAEKMPWAATPALVSFEGFPTPAEFGPLMQRYAERARQPGI
jgi:hypothetical protein